jgi:hypothetical protein
MQVIAEGTAAAAFDVADPETTAWSMHEPGRSGRRQVPGSSSGAPRALPRRRAGKIAERPPKKAVERALTAARILDHYHSASEHGIIGRQIETIVAGRF